MSEFISILRYYQEDVQIYVCSFLGSVLLAALYDVISKKIGRKNIAVKLFFSIIVALPIIIVIGVRHWTVGFDTYNYFRSYYRTGNLVGNNIMGLIDFFIEPGFKLLQIVSFLITGGSAIGAVAPMTLITVVAIFFALDRFEKGITFGLALFYLMFGLNMGDQARQIMAMAIASIGFKDLFDKRKFAFSIWVLIAALFHLSVAILLVAVPFFDVKIQRRKIEKIVVAITVLGGCVLVIFSSAFRSFIPQTYQYLFTSVNSESSIGLGFFLDVIPVILPIFLLKNKQMSFKNEIILPLIFLSIPLRYAGYITYFMMRLYYYPSLIAVFFQSINVNSVCKLKKRVFLRFSIALIYIVYFFVNYVYLGAHKMFPYISLENSGLFVF